MSGMELLMECFTGTPLLEYGLVLLVLFLLAMGLAVSDNCAGHRCKASLHRARLGERRFGRAIVTDRLETVRLTLRRPRIGTNTITDSGLLGLDGVLP